MIKTVALAALLIAAPARAQAPQPIQPIAAPDAASLAKARELMADMHIGDLIKQSLDAQAGVMTKGLADQLTQSGMVPTEAASDPEFRAILQKFFDRISAATSARMKDLIPQIVEQTTQIYARNFSAAQLSDVIAFYRTPTGQVFLTKTPQLTAESAAIARNLTMGPIIETVKAIVPEMQAELKAWADKHPQAAGTKK